MCGDLGAELRAVTIPRPRVAPSGALSLTPLDVAETNQRAQRRRDALRGAFIAIVALGALWGVAWALDAVDGDVGEIAGEVR